jgi:branched-chain amino acid transport system permease protein
MTTGKELPMYAGLTQRFPGIRYGLIGGVCAVILSLIGMVETFNQRGVISEMITMGQTLLMMTVALLAFLGAARSGRASQIAATGLLTGFITAGMLTALILFNQLVEMRQVFINASPGLFRILLFQQASLFAGVVVLLLAGGFVGLLASLLHFMPANYRKVLITAMGVVIGFGLLQDTLSPVMWQWGVFTGLNELLYASNGLSISGAITLFLIAAALKYAWVSKGQTVKTHVQGLPLKSRRRLNIVLFLIGVLLLAVLPHVAGLFLSEVLVIIGLYIMLGFGLNIIIGFSGMLDLGHVAYFAIGSYTIAVLTSAELGFFALNFWQALPFAITMGVITGILICTPVLKMRGDYLAITTLGFGEIIRLLVLSDFLKPYIGGAQGIGMIPKASIGSFVFGRPQELYYLVMAGCLLAGFIAWRLRDSRLGRSWMAVREDEDVAQAMGINLVSTKLKAFAVGAAFSALSGAIFATKLGSVYPHSFNVMISINIVCVIIVGGMGSLPGVIVGAAALVGLPELLREFAEYRLLVYGAVLVAMMLLKPAGLWPAKQRARELQGDHIEQVPATAGSSH